MHQFSPGYDKFCFPLPLPTHFTNFDLLNLNILKNEFFEEWVLFLKFPLRNCTFQWFSTNDMFRFPLNCPNFDPVNLNILKNGFFFKSPCRNCIFQWFSTNSDMFCFPLNCSQITHLCPQFWPPKSQYFEKWVRFLESSGRNCTFVKFGGFLNFSSIFWCGTLGETHRRKGCDQQHQQLQTDLYLSIQKLKLRSYPLQWASHFAF